MSTNKLYKLVWLLWGLCLVWFVFNAVRIASSSQAMLEVAVNYDAYFPLDLHYIGFSNADVEKAFYALGESALIHYKHIEQVEDFWYPISYSLVLCLTIILLCRNLSFKRGYVAFLAATPFVAMVADFYENRYIVVLIDTYPELSESDIIKASLGNAVKWLSVTYSVSLVVILALGKLMIKLKSKRVH